MLKSDDSSPRPQDSGAQDRTTVSDDSDVSAVDDELKQEGTPKHKVNSSTLRAFTALFMFVLAGIGLACHTGTGTASSFGWDYIASICPLGALEASLGALAVVPRAIVVLVVMLLVIFVAGKAFCGWMCPVPHVKNLFAGKKSKQADHDEREAAAQVAVENWRSREKTGEGKPTKPKFDSRHGVLLGALLSAAIFGFPVFCLVCPVGLSIGTFILVWRLIQFNEVSIGLIVFPVIILLEVVVFRRWCGTLCPLGALMSLVSRGNKTFRPKVDNDKCIRDTQGTSCHACSSACPELIDPYADMGKRSMTECIKCRSCVDACPAKAIVIAFKPNAHYKR